MLRRHFELGQRHVREREEHIARQREIVARLEHLREPVTLQMARDLLREMEHAQMLHVSERDRLREFLGDWEASNSPRGIHRDNDISARGQKATVLQLPPAEKQPASSAENKNAPISGQLVEFILT